MSDTDENNVQTLDIAASPILEWENHQYSTYEDYTNSKFKKLSETFKTKYSELLGYYFEWKPIRLELLNILKTSSRKLQRNSIIVSAVRLVAAVGEYVEMNSRWLQEFRGSSEEPYTNLFSGGFAILGLFYVFLNKLSSKGIHVEVKEAIEKDKNSFEKIAQWFKQTAELDRIIRSVYPYGMDEALVKSIDASCEHFDDIKFLVTIFLSNFLPNGIGNRYFSNQNRVTSVGLYLFYKVLVEDDPCNVYFVNSTLNNELEFFYKNRKNIHDEDDFVFLKDDPCTDGKDLFMTVVFMKQVLYLKTIFSTARNIWLRKKPQEVEVLEKLAKHAHKELEEIQHIIRLLTPSGLPIAI